MEAKPYSTTRICDLGDDDKPREKALANGIRSLSDAELIAIIFGGGMPGLSVIDMARVLLHSCDDRVDLVAKMSINQLMANNKGVGPAKAIALAAAFELGRRNTESAVNHIDPQVRSSQDVVNIMRPILGGIDHEEFWVLMLSRANRVTYKRCISQGGTAATVVDVKMLLKEAINCLASAIILVHNHPSGNPQPSGQDDELTKKIQTGAKACDIRVLDHVIIARQNSFSYQDEGRL